MSKAFNLFHSSVIIIIIIIIEIIITTLQHKQGNRDTTEQKALVWTCAKSGETSQGGKVTIL